MGFRMPLATNTGVKASYQIANVQPYFILFNSVTCILFFENLNASFGLLQLYNILVSLVSSSVCQCRVYYV